MISLKQFAPFYKARWNFKEWQVWIISVAEDLPAKLEKEKEESQEDSKSSESILMNFLGVIFWGLRRLSFYENLRHLLYVPFGNDKAKRVPASFTDWYMIFRLIIVIVLLTICEAGKSKFFGCFIIFLIIQKTQHNFYNLFWRYEVRANSMHNYGSHNNVRNIILSSIAFVEIILLFALAYYTVWGYSFGNKFVHAWDAIYYSSVTAATLGFGDISPQFTQARGLTVFEISISIIFISTIIARAVSIVKVQKEN